MHRRDKLGQVAVVGRHVRCTREQRKQEKVVLGARHRPGTPQRPPNSAVADAHSAVHSHSRVNRANGQHPPRHTHLSPGSFRHRDTGERKKKNIPPAFDVQTHLKQPHLCTQQALLLPINSPCPLRLLFSPPPHNYYIMFYIYA